MKVSPARFVQFWGRFPTNDSHEGRWHLVTEQHEEKYIGRCGRTFPAPPLETAPEKPNIVRGMCGSCHRVTKGQ